MMHLLSNAFTVMLYYLLLHRSYMIIVVDVFMCNYDMMIKSLKNVHT